MCIGLGAEEVQVGRKKYVLVRAPQNEYDANAIRVFGRGRQVGYVTAARARVLASAFVESECVGEHLLVREGGGVPGALIG